jgi:hypothetical protein
MMWVLQIQLASVLSAFVVQETYGFTALSTSIKSARTRASYGHPPITVLFPHQFNGYDASNAVTWSPLQASEFVVWHVGAPQDAGTQLAPMIQHWSGSQVGEFMTRLYLGEKKQTAHEGEEDGGDFKIVFESKNVRDPQWRGLSSEEGLQALTVLLQMALPKEVLNPTEIARCAEAFLLKHHTWPSSAATAAKKPANKFEGDTFASRGHCAAIAQVLGTIRKKRVGAFSAHDVIAMVTLPENDVKEHGFLQLTDFFSNIGIALTSTEKVTIVQGMAMGGWGPANIAIFVGNIQEIAEEPSNTSTVVSVAQGKESPPPTTHHQSSSASLEENTIPQNMPADLEKAELSASPTHSKNGIPKPNAGKPWTSAVLY